MEVARQQIVVLQPEIAQVSAMKRERGGCASWSRLKQVRGNVLHLDDALAVRAGSRAGGIGCSHVLPPANDALKRTAVFKEQTELSQVYQQNVLRMCFLAHQ